MRILFVSITKVIGGAEVVCKPWLENTEHEVIILTSRNNTVSKYYKNINSNRILAKYYTNNFESSIGIKQKLKFLYDNLRVLFLIKRIVKKHKIDAIYSNNTNDYFAPIMYKALFNKTIKVISHIHDMLDKQTKRARLINKLSKFPDLFFVPSRALMDNLIGLGINERKLNVVYNSVDIGQGLKKIKKIEEKIQDKYPILFIGAYNERKNIMDFVKVLEKLIMENDSYIGIIAGRCEDIDYYNRINNYIEKSKLNIITLLDLDREQINYLYSISKVLILTSHKDPLPTVILESMFNKVIVFARNVDGVPELIEDKKTGYIYDYNYNIQDIVFKLENVIRSDNEFVIENAYNKIIHQFTHEEKVNTVDSLINSLISKNSSSDHFK